MGSFSTRTSYNGKSLQLKGETAGSISIQQMSINGQTTVTIKTKADLTLTGKGELNATIVGGDQNDTWDFSQATGAFVFKSGAGKDRITDGSGASTFYDGSGDAIYDGGGGADCFIFEKDTNSTRECDVIKNFTAEDRIIIKAAGGSSDISEVEGGVLIQFGNDWIFLDGADLDEVAASVCWDPPIA